jgi:hypothetical protein
MIITVGCEGPLWDQAPDLCTSFRTSRTTDSRIPCSIFILFYFILFLILIFNLVVGGLRWPESLGTPGCGAFGLLQWVRQNWGTDRSTRWFTTMGLGGPDWQVMTVNEKTLTDAHTSGKAQGSTGSDFCRPFS